MTETQEGPKTPWYFKKSSFIVALLCVGPLALPLLWLNRRTKLINKIWITIVVLVLTYLLWIWVKESMRVINEYYKQMF